MPTPFAVQCPSCKARLKINAPDAVGKKVRCPKCETTFRVSQPKSAGPKRSKPKPPVDEFGDDEFDDFEDYEDYEDDGGFDDFESPPTRRRSASKPATSRSAKSKGKSGGSRKKKGKKKSSSSGPSPLLIGGSAAAAVLLIAILIFAFSGGSAATGSDGNVVDMTYLPQNMVGFAYVDWQQIVDSPEFSKYENTPQFQQAMKEMTAATGLTSRDAKSFTIGLVAAEPGGRAPVDDQGTVVVVRLVKPLDRSKLENDPTTSSSDYNGQQIYSSSQGGTTQLLLLENDQVIVFGQQLKTIQQVVDQGTTSPRRTQFDFVDNTQALFAAFVPPDPNAFRAEAFQGAAPQLPPMIPPNIATPLQAMMTAVQSDFIGGAIGLTPSGDRSKFKLQVQCGSSSSASTIASSGDQLLSEVSTLLEGFKAMMPPEQQTVVTDLMDGIAFDSSGQTAELSLVVPNNIADSMPGGGLPGMPSLPGFGGGGGNPVSDARDAARNAGSKNNLKQIGLAFHNYHAVYKSLPITKSEPKYFDENGQPKLSWRVHILPFLEHVPLYEQFHLDEPWDSPHNRPLVNQMPDIFKRPGSALRPGHTTYLGVKGPGAIFEQPAGLGFRDITDGLSNTIIVVEAADQNAVIWTKPGDFSYQPANPTNGLIGPSGSFNALLCDGAVRVISQTIDPQTLLHLFQRNDGNPVNF
ncbi:DUF1559 family PulG-like putative transporter [Thalassoroseus pseudoceratinae]|uniref:DUF1559 family PulG-like putative transporter n=1 Tax=Thalassoroseus pseudoceratinae TaxID=2713176 RepID=UPI00141FFE37|nr:DUF1559 domain-containing protein [Thalassoroseus pseudoceratinae]